MRKNKLTQTLTKGLRLLFIVALATGLTLGVAPVPVAHAATITVNSTADVVADDGSCTLREAITAANTNTASGVTPGECPAGDAAPITDIITLSASTTYTLTIVSTNENANANGDLDITDDLTINGAGAGSTIIDGNGSVTNDRVLHITTSGLTVNISGVTIRNGNEFDGGGIRNSDGTLNITDSTLSGNQVTGFGGGIYNDFGTVNVTNSTLSGNQANADGGGIFNWGTLTITDSTLSGNTADDRGGGIYTSGGTVTVTNSTLSGNTANQRGGGIFNNGGASNVANSTLSGNWADQHGGGICNWTGTTNLDNVTITGNTADNNKDGTGNSGGILAVSGSTVNLRNTIVAGNSDDTPSPGLQVPDCASTLTSQDYNLVGDNTNCTIAPQANDQIGTGASPIDPLLGPLADNGGDTFTHALLAGSPAIDKGSCTDIGLNPVTTDQRGVARPQGATCDIGAYEAEPKLSIGKTVTPTTDVTYHGTVTYTVVLSNSGVGHASGILLTDTLPVEVDFASWVEQPTGANVASDQITWNGTVSATTALIFTFVVTHTGNYGDVVTNTVEYSNTISGSDDATFTVIPVTYLPIIQTNNVITP